MKLPVLQSHSPSEICEPCGGQIADTLEPENLRASVRTHTLEDGR